MFWQMNKKLDSIDRKITSWMKKEGIIFLRYSLAIVFIWFGALKVFNLSPAGELVTKTVYWFNPEWFIPFLGLWEMLIGLCIIHKPWIRAGIFLMAIQMIGTFLPLILLPEIVYGNSFFALTLEGQYIIKNIVLISAAIVIGSHARDRK